MTTTVISGVLARCDFEGGGAGGGPAPVPLAVSGGPDSMALLVLAVAAGLDPVAIHVDHGLRPGSSADAELVESVASRLGAGFEARSLQVESGPDLEARARAARYDALPATVMTGHTMDDQAETVLLNLLRGAGLDGLAGMRPHQPGRPRRPLLGIRRTETAAVCREAGITPLSDPMNGDPRFRRNRVRSELLPLLESIAGRDLVPILARQAELLDADAHLLDDLAAGIDPGDARSLRSAPTPLARRSVRNWLRQAGAFPDPELHPPSAAEVGRVLGVAAGQAQACELTGGRRVERRVGRLVVTSGAPADR
ncbi:MAG: tRNA lysidine(34) synthetase TilS [Acidimicrobiales bacterium]